MNRLINRISKLESIGVGGVKFPYNWDEVIGYQTNEKLIEFRSDDIVAFSKKLPPKGFWLFKEGSIEKTCLDVWLDEKQQSHIQNELFNVWYSQFTKNEQSEMESELQRFLLGKEK